MPTLTLASMLPSSSDPERLRAWYADGLEPELNTEQDSYGILKFGPLFLLIDTRDDIGAVNPEPGRVILNFEVEDARAAMAG